MFKNVCLYRLPADWQPSIEEMEHALQANRFTPCGATQEKSVGWTEPRGEAHGPLVESIDGQRILRLAMETKSVPGAVVRKKAQEEADHIEATTGRKPGKKETRALKEDALLALLPQAFARESFTWVWLDLKNGWLVVDASSQGKVDEVISALVDAFDGLPIAPVHTAMTPQTAMSNWLLAESLDDLPGAFCVERECELKSNDEERSAVKFTRHNLATDEVRQHIREGKLPTRLALSWEGRIGFVLTESMQLKKVAFLEGVFEDRVQMDGDDSGFDTDVALSTGELRQLIPALIEALEGEISAEDALAAATASAKANAQPAPSGKVHSQVTSSDDTTEAPF
ncbi:recombination-associated protein RdgC [Hydrogenophaga sp. 5NK40-0174]|uniref:recombination-associated protein RdgC n=1 Tax=Hydrogenophaga sp. 5NK40-0174 TaxID=3127649 RepID=UPI0031044400